MESRFIVSILDSKDWDWDKEVQSRILSMLEGISCQLYNMTRKKGKKAQKPREQFQPDYVKKAKKDAERARKMKKQMSKEEMQKIENFWQRRNPKAKVWKGNYGKSEDMAQ